MSPGTYRQNPRDAGPAGPASTGSLCAETQLIMRRVSGFSTALELGGAPVCSLPGLTVPTLTLSSIAHRELTAERGHLGFTLPRAGSI